MSFRWKSFDSRLLDCRLFGEWPFEQKFFDEILFCRVLRFRDALPGVSRFSGSRLLEKRLGVGAFGVALRVLKSVNTNDLVLTLPKLLGICFE